MWHSTTLSLATFALYNRYVFLVFLIPSHGSESSSTILDEFPKIFPFFGRSLGKLALSNLFFFSSHFLFTSKRFPRLLTPSMTLFYQAVATATGKQLPTSKTIKRSFLTWKYQFKAYDRSRLLTLTKFFFFFQISRIEAGKEREKKFTVQYN